MDGVIMTTPTAETEPTATPDHTVRYVAFGIAGSAVALAAAAALTVSPRFGLGVVIGGVVALANFLVLARVGRAITGSRAQAVLWGFVYLFKVAALFGGLALLMRSGFVHAVSLVVGFAALVPGIVVGGLVAASRAPAGEPPGA